MKEFILSPEEIYYIGKVSGGKYLDYDYIAAMKDIGKRGKIKQQEILDSLERKGYAQEDFLGNLEVEPACIEILQPLYQGMYESELILREEAGESVHYKFHHMENRITSVECRSQEYRIRVQDKEGIERMLATVYKGNIIKNLIMDCQSYTKYRPNETTGGIFVSWRRKEELPTGA